MEINKRLVMTFKTTDDKKVSLSVDDPREDITESEIKSAMDLVVAKNVAKSSLEIGEELNIEPKLRPAKTGSVSQNTSKPIKPRKK